MSPVEFIKLAMLCLLEVSFCLNLARQHWNSSNSFRKMRTECFYWSEKHVKVTLFLFNLSWIFSVPDLCLKESVPEMSHLLSPFQTSESTLDWLQCVAKGLPIFEYQKFSTSCSGKRGFYYPEDIRELWHWTSRCGHVWLSGFLGSFHMADIFPSRWRGPFHRLHSEYGNGLSAVNAH